MLLGLCVNSSMTQPSSATGLVAFDTNGCTDQSPYSLTSQRENNPMLSLQSITQFRSYCLNNAMSDHTISAYTTDLTHACGQIPPTTDWADFQVELSKYLNKFRKLWSPATTKRHLASLRSWARWQGQTLLMNYRAPKLGKPQPHPIPEGIPGVIKMIYSSRNPRHRALCSLTGLAGLRVHEAIAIEPHHFDLINMMLTVHGKGSKVRYVPLSPHCWHHCTKAYVLASQRGGTLTGLTQNGARAAISRHGRNAGLSRHIASHDMRATFATAVYNQTHDLRVVQELLGHADIKTSQAYTGVDVASMRTAVLIS